MKRHLFFLALATSLILISCNDYGEIHQPEDDGLQEPYTLYYSYKYQHLFIYTYYNNDKLITKRGPIYLDFLEWNRFEISLPYDYDSDTNPNNLPFKTRQIRGTYKMTGLHDFVLTWDTQSGHTDSIDGKILSTQTICLIDHTNNTYIFDFDSTENNHHYISDFGHNIQ